MRLFNKSLLTAAIGCSGLLVGCGGGGGGGDDKDGGLAVTLESVQLAGDAAYVNLSDSADTNSVASLILRNFADLIGGQKVNAYSGTSMAPDWLDATRQLVEGQLLEINVTLSAATESERARLAELNNKCAFGNPELSIDRAVKLEENGKMNMVLAQYPAVIHDDCDVDYKQGLFIVVENGDAFKMDDPNLLFARVTPAHNGLLNISDMPLITRIQSDKFEAIIYDEQNRTITFEDLTPSTLKMHRESQYTFNGTYLAARADAGHEALLFKRGEQGFTVLDRDVIINGMFFNNDNEFMTGIAPEGTPSNQWEGLSTFNPEDQSTAVYHTQPNENFGGGFYTSFLTRYKNRIVNTNGQVWDMATNIVDCIFPDDEPQSSECKTFGETRQKVYGRYVVKYSSIDQRFFVYDLEEGSLIGNVSIKGQGYVIEANDINLYSKVAYIKVVNPDTSNKEYIEVDLITGAVTNHGVIAEGSKRVTTFLAF
jgi:hypothetical protein